MFKSIMSHTIQMNLIRQVPPSFVSVIALKKARSRSPALCRGTDEYPRLNGSATSWFIPIRAIFCISAVVACRQMSARMSVYVMATSQCQPLIPGISGFWNNIILPWISAFIRFIQAQCNLMKITYLQVSKSKSFDHRGYKCTHVHVREYFFLW